MKVEGDGHGDTEKGRHGDVEYAEVSCGEVDRAPGPGVSYVEHPRVTPSPCLRVVFS